MITEKIPLCGGTIAHYPPRGHCPKLKGGRKGENGKGGKESKRRETEGGGGKS